MDIAALGAVPSTDTMCASAETTADACDLFAALLDEAAGAPGDSLELPFAPDEKDADEMFDELAALAITSLLSLGAPVATTPDAVDEGESAVAAELTEGAETAGVATQQAALVDVSMQPQLASVETDSDSDESSVPEDTRVEDAAHPPAWDAKVRTAAATEGANVEDEAAAVNTDAKAVTGMPADIAAPTTAETRRSKTAAPSEKVATDPSHAGRLDIDTAPTVKPARGSKSSRGEHVKAADAATALADVAQVMSAEVRGQATAETSAAARPESASETPAPASTAARFARALERAAALTTNEQASAAASTTGTNNGRGQQPAFSDEAERAMQPFATPRRGSGGVSFTVAAPTAIDVRALTRAVDAASHAVDTAPVTIPERDVVAQLVQSLRVQFRDGIGEAVVKLKPEHLGSVQVSLKIENGAIKATVQAEVAAVRQWLESQQDTLRTSLAEQGLRLERFVVEPDGERQAAHDHAQQREERRREHRRRRASAAMSATDQPVFEVTV
jgi:flagellar hook-length control protein FliK